MHLQRDSWVSVLVARHASTHLFITRNRTSFTPSCRYLWTGICFCQYLTVMVKAEGTTWVRTARGNTTSDNGIHMNEKRGVPKWYLTWRVERDRGQDKRLEENVCLEVVTLCSKRIPCMRQGIQSAKRGRWVNSCIALKEKENQLL